MQESLPSVIIRQNDRNGTYIGRIAIDTLSREELNDIKAQLNALFSERGMNWYAKLE